MDVFTQEADHTDLHVDPVISQLDQLLILNGICTSTAFLLTCLHSFIS